MATIKSFTSLEQSKKLAKILPLESADMYYDDIVDSVTGELFIPNDGSTIKVGKGLCGTINAWSLAVLLDFLPFPQLSKDKLGSGKEGWMVSVYPDNCRYDSCWHDNPVDACYEMILKLHELNLL